MGAVKQVESANGIVGGQATEKEQPKTKVADPIKDRFGDLSEDNSFAAAMLAAKALQTKKNESKVSASVKFAGQSYSVVREKTEFDLKKEK